LHNIQNIYTFIKKKDGTYTLETYIIIGKLKNVRLREREREREREKSICNLK